VHGERCLADARGAADRADQDLACLAVTGVHKVVKLDERVVPSDEADDVGGKLGWAWQPGPAGSRSAREQRGQRASALQHFVAEPGQIRTRGALTGFDPAEISLAVMD